MVMIRWDFARKKAEIRQFVLPTKPIHAGIWLPANNALCIRAAKNAGFVTESTVSYLVERDPAYYGPMLANTADIAGRLTFNVPLCDVRLAHSIDYAFFDFLGGITRKTAEWMATELSPRIQRSATIAITHMVASRNNPLLPAQDLILRTHFGAQLRRSYRVLPLAYQRMLMIVHRIFNRWDFEVETTDDDIPTYKDSAITFAVLKLINFRPLSVQVYPSLEENEMKPSEVTNAMAKAVTPAQRAAAKRKLNKYVKEQEELGHDPVRTLAAIKAIVTRKKKISG